ncbi:MAG: SMC family ATPase [Candidatus Bathyarchaeota archaeon]|uniref:SMC family ATPase n=1 Tax=Candidatus Bathycorpusculum sp. TaxID=2994959 RepID=UPI00281A559A|nr:SMC family ATPase [Candidatus Termiticorpusculum sp.]MCL2256838.1 SMC family ATPase [Candidatus Termiticorpusculum sp.]MCL2293031.1 SMC family ATPase [Candidatus Termiticorpusculum sp.]
MKIDVVQLENIRSHVKSTVPFTRGFNCVVGGVGCGKSSIMYAVDFALFGGSIARGFEYLLREGAASGNVTVQFSQNGKTYKIARGLIRKGGSISQDVTQLCLYEEDTLIASIKNDAVAEQLRAITGLDRDLYRELVWFRQEQLKKLLDIAPRDRQKRLDELFGISDYEVAWSNIAQYQRDYETEKRVYAKDPDVNNIESLSNDYNRVSEEFTLLEMDLESAAQKLTIAKRVLDEAEQSLKAVEEKKLKMEELGRKEVQIRTSLQNEESSITSLNQKIADKKTLIDNLTQRQIVTYSQKQQYLTKLTQTGLPPNQSYDHLNFFLATFDDKISSLRGEQEAASKGVLTDQKRVTQLSKEDKCPLCVQALSGQYKTDLLVRIEQENVERQRIINHLRLEIADLQKAKTNASEASTGLQTCLTRETDLKSRVNEEEINLAKLIVELESHQKLELDQKVQYGLLQDEIAHLDLTNIGSIRARREQMFKQYYVLVSDLRIKENRKKDLLCRIDEIKLRIDAAQAKAKKIENLGHIIDILCVIRDAYRSIQPKLRMEFVKALRNFIQQVFDSLVGGETPLLNIFIDESYTPYVKSTLGVEREVDNLSGGERTLLAFAYRLGLGQLIMQSRSGHGLSLLMLDEPTENLGSEDGSIEHLAEAISRFKAIEQIIAVTHSEVFADKAEHVITLEKEDDITKLSMDR